MSHQLWQTLIKHNVSPNQVYYLDCLKHKIVPTSIINVDFERVACFNKGLITEEGTVSYQGLVVLRDFQKFLVKMNIEVASSVLGDEYMEKISKYVDQFPKIKLPSGSFARQKPDKLVDRFVWFFKEYPDFSWDDVIDAAALYVYEYSLKSYEYMMTSEYFIKKSDFKTKESRSLLADYCQYLIDNPDI